MASVQKSFLGYFSPLSPVLFILELFQGLLRQENAKSTQKYPTPTISNSGCGNQDGPTLAEVQDGSALAEVQDGPAPSKVQSCPVQSETHDLGSTMSQSVKPQVARLYFFFNYSHKFSFLAKHLTVSLFHILIIYQHDYFLHLLTDLLISYAINHSQ